MPILPMSRAFSSAPYQCGVWPEWGILRRLFSIVASKTFQPWLCRKVKTPSTARAPTSIHTTNPIERAFAAVGVRSVAGVSCSATKVASFRRCVRAVQGACVVAPLRTGSRWSHTRRAGRAIDSGAVAVDARLIHTGASGVHLRCARVGASLRKGGRGAEHRDGGQCKARSGASGFFGETCGSSSSRSSPSAPQSRLCFCCSMRRIICDWTGSNRRRTKHSDLKRPMGVADYSSARVSIRSHSFPAKLQCGPPKTPAECDSAVLFH